MSRQHKRIQGAAVSPGLLRRLEVCRRTPVLDHADEVLFFADRQKVAELLNRRDIGVLGDSHRITALRMQGPDPSSSGQVHFHPGLGSPHRNETYYNPSGTWTFDRLPSHLRPDFERVLRSCISRAA